MSCECDKRLISPRSGVQIFTQLFTSDAIYCEGAHCAQERGAHPSITWPVCTGDASKETDRERESCKFYNIISDNFTHISHTHTHALQHSGQSTLHVFYDIQHRFIFYTPFPPLPTLAKGSF